MRGLKALGPSSAVSHNATASGGTTVHSKPFSELPGHRQSGRLQEGATELSRYGVTLVCCKLKPAEEQSCKPTAEVMHVLMLQGSLHCDTGDNSGQEWHASSAEITRITCAWQVSLQVPSVASKSMFMKGRRSQRPMSNICTWGL